MSAWIMVVLQPKDSLELNKIVLDYLQGVNLAVIQLRLQTVCIEYKTSGEALYRLIKTNRKDNVESILVSLNKSNTDDQHLTQCTNLYDVLSHLCSQSNRHLIRLLKMIENTKPKKSWALFFMLGTLLSAGLGGLAVIKKESVEVISQWVAKNFPFFIKWLEKTFSLLRNFHLLAGMVNGLILAWDWYYTLTNQRATRTEKLQTLLFKTLSASLTITAYLLCFFAAGTATLPAIILFVSSAATQFLQGSWLAWCSSVSPPQVTSLNSSWEELAEYERAKSFQARHQSSAWITICTSILTTMSVIIWYAFPLSFFVSACFLLFNVLLGLTEQSILSAIDETADNNLQSVIRALPSEDKTPNYQQRLPELEARLAAVNETIADLRKVLDRHQECPTSLLMNPLSTNDNSILPQSRVLVSGNSASFFSSRATQTDGPSMHLSGLANS